ncbi:MAG: phytanoyl-CoA dioxygenase family protein [Candidatus Poribacteria bacterium]|nr:phytanoyl-CoA dioxygenase family protein [Candidatus Poribacteria bacterium]
MMPEEYQNHLLTDAQVAEFVVRGYLVFKPDFPEGFNDQIYKECAAATAHGNPGDAILERVPKLHDVWDHPVVKGALASLLGDDFTMSGHRHCHVNPPGSRSQGWHQDGVNQRHHQVRVCLGFYYPQATPHELGPTSLVPGTHFRNAPTDRMASYANFRDQVDLVCEAGTVAIVHYDIWHAATRNCGNKTRYMLKFLFNRASEPTRPNWNHDPASIGKAMGILGGRATINGQSDHYKERRLRREMWNHLVGAA